MSKLSKRRFRVARRRVLITGGASGIGRLMAFEAARRGASEVIIWDLDGDAAETVAAEIRSRGRHASAYPVDVTEVTAVNAAAEQVGRVDVLINNAGVVTGKPLLDASEAEIERTFQVNTMSLYWVTRAFLPGMIAQRRGYVVNIASAAGLVGVANQTDYSASKHAAVGFTESLRAEMKKQRTRVRTLSVAPFYIDTGMFEGVKTKVPALLPILEPAAVARQVLDAVERGRSRLVLPKFVYLVPFVRGLPTPVFDFVMNRFGINETMDDFVGRR